jgi:hypothetical protein
LRSRAFFRGRPPFVCKEQGRSINFGKTIAVAINKALPMRKTEWHYQGKLTFIQIGAPFNDTPLLKNKANRNNVWFRCDEWRHCLFGSLAQHRRCRWCRESFWMHAKSLERISRMLQPGNVVRPVIIP